MFRKTNRYVLHMQEVNQGGPQYKKKLIRLEKIQGEKYWYSAGLPFEGPEIFRI